MRQHEASRTLVKSPPELWAECSDASSLARHLDQFGDIRITKLEPETAVAWEGERGSGTVRIEPSGWGTKVILTAVSSLEEVVAEPVAVDRPGVVDRPGEAIATAVEAASEETATAAEPPARRRRFGRLFAFLRAEAMVDEPAASPEPQPEAAAAVETEPAPGPEPVLEAPTPATEAALCAALDSLGQAHHRPYSRG